MSIVLRQIWKNVNLSFKCLLKTEALGYEAMYCAILLIF